MRTTADLLPSYSLIPIDKPMATQSTKTKTKTNKQLARKLNSGLWNEKDNSLIEEMISEDCVLHVGKREFRGPKGYRQFFETYTRAFPDLSIQINDLIAENDFVVDRYTARGQHTGPLMDIDPTGKQVKINGVSISRFRDGKLVESNNLFNEMSLMQQLGVLPESVLRKLA
jgi:steroid delta-isomerase-like uncharacterized protein